MDKLLIAERDASLRDGLVELLRHKYDITTCTDGRTCLELLHSLRPEAAIIDLALTELEGIYVIEQALDHLPPIVLCVTDFATEYVAQTLQDLGVDYLFRRPCFPRAIAARLEHLAAHRPQPGQPDLQTRTARLLQSMGFIPKSDGFQYLRIGMPLFYQDPTQLICKELYASIAHICGLNSWKPVERSIRSAIHAAWSAAPSLWEPYFPGLDAPPTGKAFICQMVQHLEDDTKK